MSVRDQEENDIVFNLKTVEEKRDSVSEETRLVWIGATRVSPAFPWQWTDSSDWVWQKWEPTKNEPDGVDLAEYCLQMYFGYDGVDPDDRLGFWNDHPCHLKHPFICEKNKN